MANGTVALLIPIVAMVCGFGFLTLLVLLKFILRLRGDKTKGLSEEEEKMLRELWTGLQKMETRISNLETILISRERR